MHDPEDPVAEAKRLLAAGEAHHAELLAISPRLLAALCERLEAAERECDAPWHKERAWDMPESHWDFCPRCGGALTNEASE